MPFNFCNVLIPSYQLGNAKRDPLSGIWGSGELLLITAVVLSSSNGLNKYIKCFYDLPPPAGMQRAAFAAVYTAWQQNLYNINLQGKEGGNWFC